MMDGYAVRAADTLGASPYNRRVLSVLGAALPGRPFEATLAGVKEVGVATVGGLSARELSFVTRAWNGSSPACRSWSPPCAPPAS